MRCSARTARDWCISSHTSARFSCPTTLGSGRNDPDRHPVSSDGPLSRSTTLRACCRERHSQRSWTTTERWSGATHLSTEGRLQRCAGEPSGVTQPTGPQITTPPKSWSTVFVVSSGTKTFTGPPPTTLCRHIHLLTSFQGPTAP